MKYLNVKCPRCDEALEVADNNGSTRTAVCPQCLSKFRLSAKHSNAFDKSQTSNQSKTAASVSQTARMNVVIESTVPSVESQIGTSENGFLSGKIYRFFADKTSVASATSFLLHLSLILFLGVCVIAPELHNGMKSLSLVSASVDDGPEAELISFDIAEALPNLQLASVEMNKDVSIVSTIPDISIDYDLDIPPATQVVPTGVPSDTEPLGNRDGLDKLANTNPKGNRLKQGRPKSASAWISSISKKGVNVLEPLLVEPKDGLRQTGSAATAATGVMDKLTGSIDQEGPLAIIWLMDASLSLLAERQALAPQVFAFYQGLRVKAKESRLRLTTSVFAFGQQIVPVQLNLGFLDPDAVAGAIHNLPIDKTGNENVMSAISLAINSVPTFPPNTRIEVVLWTDESGDDLAMLEDVIQLCRQRRARVHVVGPLSVFGMEGGLQQFTLPAPNLWSVLLPVKRGPDSAFPERAQLPLWHDSQDVNWGSDTLIPAASSVQNLGGPHRQLLLAPSGPYALTRLALATGGSYTALNRAGDLAAAEREQLFEYMPDYRSGMQIAYDIDKYPLRKAVIEAAALTGTANYWPPPLAYPNSIYNRFPFNRYVFYSPPQRFARELKLQLAVGVERLLGPQAIIEQAIQIMLLRFKANSYESSMKNDQETGLQIEDLTLESISTSEYDQEESPRWRAWYDLNLGRLLAHSVRISEYINHCKRLAEPDVKKTLLDREINCITFQPSATIIGGTACTHRMELASQLLTRVVDKHPNTPWSDLASWELQSALGMEPVPSIIPPPVPVPPLPAQPRPEIPRL
jgi:hypothetical protein